MTLMTPKLGDKLVDLLVDNLVDMPSSIIAPLQPIVIPFPDQYVTPERVPRQFREALKTAQIRAWERGVVRS